MPGIDAGAPERTETSSGSLASPNFVFVSSSTRASACVDLGREPAGIVPGAVLHHVAADLGRDREAGRHRQAERRHLGEVRALAAEQRLVLGAAFGGATAELTDVLHEAPPSRRKSAIAMYGVDEPVEQREPVVAKLRHRDP